MKNFKLPEKWQGLPIIIVGDIHNEHARLQQKIIDWNISDCIMVQVGDNALGFPGFDKKYYKKQNKFYKSRNILFLGIVGNHDDPAFQGYIRFANYKILHNYTYCKINNEKWLFVGGAISIDRTDRVEGVSYWKNEAFELKREWIKKCDVLVTHSTPTWIGPISKLPYWCSRDPLLWDELVKERKDIDILYALAKPSKSYSGHFHEFFYISHDGCEARILDILEFYEHVSVDKSPKLQ